MLVICLVFSLLLAGTSGYQVSATSTCDDGEVTCLNGECIPHYLWCDKEIDCADGSDESACDDGSQNATDVSKSQLAVVEAANYLLSQRKADYGWDDFTARALIGLSFAEKYLPISEKDKVSMMKRLELQLLFLLKDGIENLATLALHINALYAMCKDPSDFHGIDLVELLRSKTDKAMKKSDFNLPAVFLTLCIANETKDGDFDKLFKIYSDKRNDRIGVKALTLIAMNCYNLQAGGLHTFAYDVKISEFIQEYKNQDKNIDVYSKALICQAYNARGYDTTSLRNELLSVQAEDGSFGDLLGTYSVIPALLNRSLSDLQCKTRKYKAKPAKREFSSSDQIFKPERQIDYSVWIPTGENAGFHTLRITFDGEKSFYDLMKMAESRNPMYRFKYDELKGTGKKVYYLAGIPNDIEKGSAWTLYRQIADRISQNSTINRQKQVDGVDKIFPQDGEHFLFQLEEGKML